ncbi:hypothetical protein B0H14DRAFT_2989245, partial [Mycena olivaceomarginata]
FDSNPRSIPSLGASRPRCSTNQRLPSPFATRHSLRARRVAYLTHISICHLPSYLAILSRFCASTFTPSFPPRFRIVFPPSLPNAFISMTPPRCQRGGDRLRRHPAITNPKRSNPSRAGAPTRFPRRVRRSRVCATRALMRSRRRASNSERGWRSSTGRPAGLIRSTI